MSFLVNLKIGLRLALLLTALLLTLLLVAATGLWGQASLFGRVQHAIEHDLKLAEVSAEMRSQVLQARRFEKDSLLNLQRPEALAGYVDKWRSTRLRLTELLGQARTLQPDGDGPAMLTAMEQALATYGTRFEQVVAGIDSGQWRDAAAANAELDRTKAAIRGLEKAADDLADQALQRAARVLPELRQHRTTLSAQQVGFTIVGLLVAAVAGWLVTRSITRPLQQAVDVADAVARGELDGRVQVRGRDEVAQLLTALQRMTGRLRELVAGMRDASDSIATGSGQIAAGNADLSRRTEQQAANLQQTAASMEELTAAVAANAGGARKATQLADAVAGAAQQGGGVVTQVVQTMEAISESSRQIADITGLIDGIAFQTNILALNAAVEAARAGEQGRGFAVVAGEVRSLAQRSAEAARQITALIGGSAERVDQGARLAQQAGSTMEGLVDEIRQVAVLVREISESSAQQDDGIRQVGQAVSQLDRVTQQNAALVEQSAAAAEGLRAQAERLAQTVAVFRLQAK